MANFEPTRVPLDIHRAPTDMVLVTSNEVLKAIIKCESSGIPTAIGYNKIDGEVWSKDYGLLQVNDYYHAAEMEAMGLDITNPADSLEYGIYLYETQGTAPWSASEECRKKELALVG